MTKLIIPAGILYTLIYILLASSGQPFWLCGLLSVSLSSFFACFAFDIAVEFEQYCLARWLVSPLFKRS